MKTKQLLSGAFFAAALLLSSSALFAQVKIGTAPTTIDPANNLEVQGSTAGRKVAIDKTTGKVTIADGSEGDGKVFSSDANGVGTWKALRSTSIVSFPQDTPGTSFTITPTPGGAAAAGGSYCAAPGLGSSPAPACAIDLNRNATFATTTSTNDIIMDVTGLLSVAGNTNGQVQLIILLYVDKTTPGVYELVDSYFVSSLSATCSGYYLNYKTTLKNLPPRNYNVKTYALKWVNQSTSTASVGIGASAVPGCGQNDFPNQKLTVSVSE